MSSQLSADVTTSSSSRKFDPAISSAAHSAWRPLTRFAFGIVCGYFLLVWVPWGIALLGNHNIPGWEAETIGRWVMVHVLRLPEHSDEPTATNYLPGYLAPLALAAFSAICSVVWLVADRRPTSGQRMFVWLHTGVRFLLGALMLSYGWAKLLPSQFGRFAAGTGADYLITPDKDLLVLASRYPIVTPATFWTAHAGL